MNKAVIYQGDRSHIRLFEAPCALSTLLEDFHVAHPCGGKGTCGKCCVDVRGVLSPATAAEANAVKQGKRLVCQTIALGDVQITLPRVGGWSKSVADRTLAAHAPLGNRFGWVIDVGTTTVSVTLYDQTDGTACAHTVLANPQSAFGADVVARMDAALHGQSAALSQCICDALKNACCALLRRCALSPDDVDAAVLTGNTAMLYLLFGIDPACLSAAPFVCSTRFGAFYPADFLPMRHGTQVYIPRCISAFLGADILTASLASALWENGTHLLADLGTNAEILLQREGEVFGCSCAAGPAFESAGLSCGMPAVDGSIETVRLTSGRLICQTHGNVPAVGICGSGLIDLIACLRKNGTIRADGLLQCGDRFTIEGTNVYITQKDIRAFQLSKSAVRTGIEMLLKESEISVPDTLEIAGTFGTHLSVPNAQKIGLLPPLAAMRVSAIGNAAAVGAAMLLLDRTRIDPACENADSIHTVPLAQQEMFHQQLLQNLSLE